MKCNPNNRQFLNELAAALDALPEKRLVAEVFEIKRGMCAVGCFLKAKGRIPSTFENLEAVANTFQVDLGLLEALIEVNDSWEGDFDGNLPDEVAWDIQDVARYTRVCKWVDQQLAKAME